MKTINSAVNKEKIKSCSRGGTSNKAAISAPMLPTLNHMAKNWDVNSSVRKNATNNPAHNIKHKTKSETYVSKIYTPKPPQIAEFIHLGAFYHENLFLSTFF